MATSTRSSEIDGEQCVVMRGIGWKGYKAMLRLRGGRSMPRMIYLDGDLLLMSPSFPHERLKERFGIFVIEVVVGLDIPCVPSGATTFRRKVKRGGVEPDHSFYLENEARVRGKKELHLRTDPPPDLVIEAVHTHDADEAIEVYRRFGVPEVWVGDEEGVRFLVLDEGGEYAEPETSRAFPFLKAGEVFDWVGRPQDVSETEWVKALRRWVRETLAPRIGREA